MFALWGKNSKIQIRNQTNVRNIESTWPKELLTRSEGMRRPLQSWAGCENHSA